MSATSRPTERISDVAWAQTEGGLAVVKAALQLEEFERQWLPVIAPEHRVAFTMQLGELVQAARLAGQKEE